MAATSWRIVRLIYAHMINLSMLKMATVLGLCFFSNAGFAQAYVFQGIYANDTLQDLKDRFPNGNFRSVKAAWVSSAEAFYSMSGLGLTGEFRIAFLDVRADCQNKLTAAGLSEADNNYYRDCLSYSDGRALLVNWVRWIPPAPLQLSRVSARYGVPVCKESESFENVCSWGTAGISATLNSDGRTISMLDRNFTLADFKAAVAR
jgi:hypothetical protein